ncbi:hypothetical protein [Mesorhizobium sp. M1307]|uniref:hypothetical protein n=1 Tax=Mesorhizobium sp. M1307 TaxID=2957079 RepID=UPI0033372011
MGKPVLGTGCTFRLRRGTGRRIQGVLDKYDLLLIANEVVCGFARTGEKFGSHQYGKRPCPFPVRLSATASGRSWNKELRSTALWAMAGHTLGTRSARRPPLPTFRVLKERNILEHVRDVGPYWLSRMKAERHIAP